MGDQHFLKKLGWCSREEPCEEDIFTVVCDWTQADDSRNYSDDDNSVVIKFLKCPMFDFQTLRKKMETVLRFTYDNHSKDDDTQYVICTNDFWPTNVSMRLQATAKPMIKRPQIKKGYIGLFIFGRTPEDEYKGIQMKSDEGEGRVDGESVPTGIVKENTTLKVEWFIPRGKVGVKRRDFSNMKEQPDEIIDGFPINSYVCMSEVGDIHPIDLHDDTTTIKLREVGELFLCDINSKIRERAMESYLRSPDYINTREFTKIF